MANMFRLLRADEIDVRVGNVKQGEGISLLLYKDARCDQNILDETVGPYNWQRTHSRDNANCTVSIWDEKKQQWISKEDTGTESKTEAEKGLASDSFKRACFNWGIGRELYSAPFIWISGNDTNSLKYMRFTVHDIGYDSNNEINKLVISDKHGNIMFNYIRKGAQRPEEKASVQEETNAIEMIRQYCEEVNMTSGDFGKIKSELVANKQFKPVAYNQMTIEQAIQLIELVERKRIA